LSGGESLAQQFTALLERIAQDASLDEDTRELAQDKTKAVAAGLAKVEESPGIKAATAHADQDSVDDDLSLRPDTRQYKNTECLPLLQVPQRCQLRRRLMTQGTSILRE
jgi:uncharacterized protein (UPF0147 family)